MAEVVTALRIYLNHLFDIVFQAIWNIYFLSKLLDKSVRGGWLDMVSPTSLLAPFFLFYLFYFFNE